MNWEEFIRMRDSVASPRSFVTMDGALVQQGVGGKFAMMAFPDASFRSLADVERRVVLAKGAPVESGFFAAYLPLAQADLLVRLEKGEAVELALYPEGGPLRKVGRDDAALRELAPASLTRAAHAMLPGGVVALDASKLHACLDEALRLWPGYAPALVTRGKAAKAKGDVSSARRAFEEASTFDFALAWFHLGDVLDEIDENARALDAYDRAVSGGLRTADLFCQRATVLRRLGRPEEFVASAKEALIIDQHHAPTLSNLAGAFIQAQDAEGAVTLVSGMRPSRLEPTFRRNAIIILGECAKQRVNAGQWPQAARCFALMTEHDPSDARAWANWGVALLNMQALQDAAAKLRRAAELDPHYEKPRSLLPGVEKQVSAGFPERSIGQRSVHTIRYTDSHGVQATLFNFVAKVETTHRFIETEVTKLSLERDKDLLKLLAAKGHNARLERITTTPEKTGLLSRVMGRPRAESTSGFVGGRPISFIVEEPPSLEFLAFADAPVWYTSEGNRVESVAVEVWDAAESPRRLTPPDRGAEFRLSRTLEFEVPGQRERFFPHAFSLYD